jgi:hypothetical protein
MRRKREIFEMAKIFEFPIPKIVLVETNCADCFLETHPVNELKDFLNTIKIKDRHICDKHFAKLEKKYESEN